MQIWGAFRGMQYALVQPKMYIKMHLNKYIVYWGLFFSNYSRLCLDFLQNNIYVYILTKVVLKPFSLLWKGSNIREICIKIVHALCIPSYF